MKKCFTRIPFFSPGFLCGHRRTFFKFWNISKSNHFEISDFHFLKKNWKFCVKKWHFLHFFFSSIFLKSEKFLHLFPLQNKNLAKKSILSHFLCTRSWFRDTYSRSHFLGWVFGLVFCHFPPIFSERVTKESPTDFFEDYKSCSDSEAR